MMRLSQNTIAGPPTKRGFPSTRTKKGRSTWDWAPAQWLATCKTPQVLLRDVRCVHDSGQGG